MFLEVIATNLKDCEDIMLCGNVDRIELCQALEHGGYTPEYEVIRECSEKIILPIRVIVRHSDKNFYCDDKEFEQIKADINFIKTTKAKGIVVGILTNDNKVDYARMNELMKLASGLDVTFHRAFDLILDKKTAIKQLAQLGIKTVLTQGGVNSILQNLTILKNLQNYGVQIQGGSGINLNNYHRVLKVCDAIHIGSAIRMNESWQEPIDIVKLKQIR